MLENPDSISKRVLEKGLDAGTAFEILSIDIADIDVGDNIGANLQAAQAEADTRVARAKAEERRAFAVAMEQEIVAGGPGEPRQGRSLAEAEVPLAIAEAFRKGNLGITDYYNLRNIQADTEMRSAIAGTGNNARRDAGRRPDSAITRPIRSRAGEADDHAMGSAVPVHRPAHLPGDLGADLAVQPRGEGLPRQGRGRPQPPSAPGRASRPCGGRSPGLAAGPAAAGSRSGDDDILIIQATRRGPPGRARPGRPARPVPRQVEPGPTADPRRPRSRAARLTTKLGGRPQTVNQQLANPIG